MATSFGSIRRSVVIDDLDFGGVAVAPPKADAPLVVDPDAHPPLAVALQRLQAVARRVAQVVQRPRGVELTQLPERPVLHVGRKPAAAPSRPDALRLLAAEG